MGFLGEARILLRRMAAGLQRRRLDTDLREEIEAHIRLRAQQFVNDGMDPRAAAYEARRLFGNPTLIQEEARAMWSFQWTDSLVQDLRFGMRLLRRAPLFTASAVASLAIGLGASTAVFSLGEHLLLRELPVRNPGELLLLRWHAGQQLPFRSLSGHFSQRDGSMSSTSFPLAVFDQARSVVEADGDASLFGFADLARTSLTADGRSEIVAGQVVSGNYFTVLGIGAAAGRLLGPGDDHSEAPPAAVIGYELWQRRFGGAADVVGRSILLNATTFTIAGVLPQGFQGTLQAGQRCDVMVPLAMHAAVSRSRSDADPDFWWVLLMGRARTAAAGERLRSVVDTALKQTLLTAQPAFDTTALPRVAREPGNRGQREDRDEMRSAVRILAGVVTLVLLVACANVANLLLARGRARSREVAMRAAIGASRRRLVRQLLTEGLLVGLLASAAGLLVSRWIAAGLMPAVATSDMAVAPTLSMATVFFTSALGIACTVLFALAPALRTTDAGLQATLHDSGRGTVGSRRRFAVGGSLVVVQVGISLVLLSGAALLVWSAARLQRIDPGFDPDRLLTLRVDTTLAGYDQSRTRQYVDGALEALRALPGVTGASAASHALIAGSGSSGVSRPEGTPPLTPNTPEYRAAAERNLTWRQVVDDRYFETLRIPILAGRGFPASLRPDGTGIVVVNEALARQLFGTTDVLGRRVLTTLRDDGQALEIVGVAGNAHYASLRTDPPPTVYLPYQQERLGRVVFHLRTAGDPLGQVEAVRETLRRIDASLPLFDVRTQSDQIRHSLAQERLFASLAAWLGVVALALSTIGLYGLLAYAVTWRTPEIGVRIALGAERQQVRWLVLSQSMRLVGLGVAVGVPASLWATAALESVLFDLSPTDPRALVAAAGLMTAVALTAAYVPARRASRIDPLTALRAE